jgi:hypothetical protein
MEEQALLIRFTKSLLNVCDTRVKRLAISDALHRAAALTPEARLLVDAPEMQSVFRDIYGDSDPFQDFEKQGLAKW